MTNPYFICEAYVQAEIDCKERHRKARMVGKKKRAERLHREGRPLTRAITETHWGVTTIVIRGLE